ncbi:hypothetical protein CASFOL_036448 [Castilleja foliolosa]|uniref:Uncharacterized protein n=1 Tax=Castilleja foliolosa TaxID=1961234 RepID=A0ABD3BX67_9LAMI
MSADKMAEYRKVTTTTTVEETLRYPEPELTEPETTKPEPTKPETTKPETTKPEPTKPETTEPDLTALAGDSASAADGDADQVEGDADGDADQFAVLFDPGLVRIVSRA